MNFKKPSSIFVFTAVPWSLEVPLIEILIQPFWAYSPSLLILIQPFLVKSPSLFFLSYLFNH